MQRLSQHVVRSCSILQRPTITHAHSQLLREEKRVKDCRKHFSGKNLNLDVSSHGYRHNNALLWYRELTYGSYPGLLSTVYPHEVKHKQCSNDQESDKEYYGFKFERLYDDLFITSWLVAGVLIGREIHRWRKYNNENREKEKCLVHIINRKALSFINAIESHADILKIPWLCPSTHVSTTLAANAKMISSVPAISNKDVSDETSEITTQTLDEAFAVFKLESDKCCGALLNKYALEYRNDNRYEMAFELFLSAAADYGHVPSIYNVALCYEFGHGVEVSLETAAKYYSEAADKGHVQSMFNIATFHYEGNGWLSEENEKFGFQYMKKAADRGLAQACSFVALKYTEEENWNEAYKYFKMAAMKEDKSSLFNVAVCFENGLGTETDVIRAMEYYRRAAETGDRLSQFYLGDSYEHGLRGVKKDLKESLKWFQLAMENGQPESKKRVEILKELIAEEKSEQNGESGKYISFLKSLVEPKYKESFLLSLK